MKQIPLLSDRCLVVELPEGAINPHIHPNSNWLWYKYEGDKGGFSYKRCDLPSGNWRIIGMLSEVTGEQISDIIDSVSVICTDGTEYGGWRNYVCRDDFDETILLNTAIESLESAILAEGYLLESPPNPKCGCFGPPEEGVCPDCDEYMESLSRVLDRSRCLLLGREGA